MSFMLFLSKFGSITTSGINYRFLLQTISILYFRLHYFFFTNTLELLAPMWKCKGFILLFTKYGQKVEIVFFKKPNSSKQNWHFLMYCILSEFEGTEKTTLKRWFVFVLISNGYIVHSIFDRKDNSFFGPTQVNHVFTLEISIAICQLSRGGASRRLLVRPPHVKVCF